MPALLRILISADNGPHPAKVRARAARVLHSVLQTNPRLSRARRRAVPGLGLSQVDSPAHDRFCWLLLALVVRADECFVPWTRCLAPC